MFYAPRGVDVYAGASKPLGADSTTVLHPPRSDDDIRAAVIAALDRAEACEGELHALLPEPGRRERVLATLDTLFARYRDPSSRPPLFGVPVGVKDIFRADAFQTRAGSKLPPELFAGAESTALTRLRAAGAIVLGKTVTTEFAFAHPGPTRSPWKTDHTPGGSSSGSAAGVAAGYCPIALGTQTIGSINRPAGFCGVVGLKPSYGRVPTDGVVPFSVSADHVGLLAADVASARAAAAVMWDGWRANASSPREKGAAGETTATGDTAAARSGRVSRPLLLVLDDAYSAQANGEMHAGLQSARGLLESAGWTVETATLFNSIDELNDRHNRMIARDFADVHADWLKRYRELYAARTVELIDTGRGVSDDELAAARAGREELWRRIDRLFEETGADAILTPSSQSPAPIGIDSTGSPLLNLPWTYAGVPTVTLPAAVTAERLPVGVQLVGRFGADEELLRLAAGAEAALRFVERVP
jgi:Asp-tRNA(Asn)/Glu-tRNA(Gln) amidotransferase A subunit family amidase